MAALAADETEIDSETDVTVERSGRSALNDAFDLYLVKTQAGDYRLVVFMKVQFFFEDGSGGRWSQAEKVTFVNDWKLAIQSRWSGRTVRRLADGKPITVAFRFETQIEGWMFDHWEITVTKVSAFTVSSVEAGKGNVSLDTLDLQLSRKSGGEMQRGAVHEFGHMLGLADEYKKNGTHSTDYRSVMNSGEMIFSRHDAAYATWLDKKLVEHGIQ